MTTETVALTKEAAVKMAFEVERTEAALKQMKAKLKEYVDANGALEAGDQVWDYSVSVSWSFEAEKLKELAQFAVIEGHNPWELLSFPAAALKKTGWAEATLQAYGTRKETKKFDSRKAKK